MQCAVSLPRITELNPHLICVLCGGYYIDATTIVECLHAFCKSCIVRYLETNKYCPICDVLVHKSQPLQNIRPDKTRQSIVYKLIPNLYKREMRNRRKFYIRVQPQFRPPNDELSGQITEASTFFSFDDTINLSLEYLHSAVTTVNQDYVLMKRRGRRVQNVRYFKCEAAVTVENLRKLLAAKYDLRMKHEIRFFLQGSQLPEHFKLLDVAYIASWKRVGYIPLFFEILIEEKQKQESKETRKLTPADDETELTSTTHDAPTVPRTSTNLNTTNETKKSCATTKQLDFIVENEKVSTTAFEKRNCNEDLNVLPPKIISTQCTLSVPVLSIDSVTTTISSADSKRIENVYPRALTVDAKSPSILTQHETIKSTNDIGQCRPDVMVNAQDAECAFERTATVNAKGDIAEIQEGVLYTDDENHKRKSIYDDDKLPNVAQETNHSSKNDVRSMYSRKTATTTATATVTMPAIRTTTKTSKLTAKSWNKCAFTTPSSMHFEIREAAKYAKMFKTSDTQDSASNQTTSKARIMSTCNNTPTAVTTANKPSKANATANSVKSASVIRIDPKTLSPIVTLPFSNSGGTTTTTSSADTMRNVSHECAFRTCASSTSRSFAPFYGTCATNITSKIPTEASAIAGNQLHPNLQPNSLLPMDQLMRRLFSNLDAESSGGDGDTSKTAVTVRNLCQHNTSTAASLYSSHRHYQHPRHSLHAYKRNVRVPPSLSALLPSKRNSHQKGENKALQSKTPGSSVRLKAAVDNNVCSRTKSSPSKVRQLQRIQNSGDNVIRAEDGGGNDDNKNDANIDKMDATRTIVREKATEISNFFLNNLIALDKGELSKFHCCSAVDGVEKCDQIHKNTGQE